MQYLVTGVYQRHHTCDCEFCPGHESEHDYRDVFSAISEGEAVALATHSIQDDLDWGEKLKWLTELKAAGITGAWFFTGEIMATDGYRTNGFVAVREQYAADQPVTSDKKPDIAKFMASMTAVQKLFPADSKEAGRVTVLSDGNGYHAGIDTRYYQMFCDLGTEFWRSTGGANREGFDAVLVIKDGETIGAIMQMHRPSNTP
jgi:hypothetical protein